MFDYSDIEEKVYIVNNLQKIRDTLIAERKLSNESLQYLIDNTTLVVDDVSNINADDSYENIFTTISNGIATGIKWIVSKLSQLFNWLLNFIKEWFRSFDSSLLKNRVAAFDKNVASIKRYESNVELVIMSKSVLCLQYQDFVDAVALYESYLSMCNICVREINKEWDYIVDDSYDCTDAVEFVSRYNGYNNTLSGTGPLSHKILTEYVSKCVTGTSKLFETRSDDDEMKTAIIPDVNASMNAISCAFSKKEKVMQYFSDFNYDRAIKPISELYKQYTETTKVISDFSDRINDIRTKCQSFSNAVIAKYSNSNAASVSAMTMIISEEYNNICFCALLLTNLRTYGQLLSACFSTMCTSVEYVKTKRSMFDKLI